MRVFQNIEFTEKQKQNLDELTRVWFINKKQMITFISLLTVLV